LLLSLRLRLYSEARLPGKPAAQAVAPSFPSLRHPDQSKLAESADFPSPDSYLACTMHVSGLRAARMSSHASRITHHSTLWAHFCFLLSVFPTFLQPSTLNDQP
jgi:hypothetical protein